MPGWPTSFKLLTPLWALAVMAGGVALPGFPASGQTNSGQTNSGYGYRVVITGTDDGDLRSRIDAASTLIQLKDDPPPSAIGLRRRADDDRERLMAALRSEGYYDGSVAITIDKISAQDKGVPDKGTPDKGGPDKLATVTLTVTQGPPYRFRRIEALAAPGALSAPLAKDAAALGLEPGGQARATEVVAAERRLVELMARRGFAFAKISERQAEIDRTSKSMDLRLRIAPGPIVRLGAVRISGLEQVAETLVRGRIAWTPGELFSPELIERTRADLNKLGVFSSVRLQIAEQAEPDGSHPVTITVTERKRHLIGVGATFSSAEGLGGQVYWGHRNLFGNGEQLRVEADLDRLNVRTLSRAGLDAADEKLSAELRKPDFLAGSQDLVVTTAAINEHPEAYRRQALTSQARLEDRIGRHLIFGYGLSAEQSNITDFNGYTSAALVGAPLSLAYDTTDSLLNPKQGVRLVLESTPWLRIGDTGHNFLVNRITESAYHDLTGNGQTIVAGRLSFGSIANGTVSDLPADKRLYAGGGGSVRGYAYQKAGPLDVNGNPTGGQSLVEASAELRIRITDELGLVPFIDGGTVYATPLPQSSETLHFGTGLGVRYYTSFGPLRLDVGVPLNARAADDPVQVYLSLGQAF